MLRHLPRFASPDLLVGSNPADDAAVFRLRDDLALVQTVDFFTPIVDDPYTFGQIAAANALSDVYAMGGDPLTALNLVAFPVTSLPLEILAEIMRGGAEKAAEAGVPIVGGHTVDDPEPKYGLAVTGTVHPEKVITAHGALPGDLLLLTKPVGTGVVATALKAGKAQTRHVMQAVRWMTTLNKYASATMREVGAHAATDITGFGLLGHLADLCRASGVSARLYSSRMPLLPGALDYVVGGYIPGGGRANLESAGKIVRWDDNVDIVMRQLMTDPQTSGGLLIAVDPALLSRFQSHVTASCLFAEIGRVEVGEPGTVFVEVYGARNSTHSL